MAKSFSVLTIIFVLLAVPAVASTIYFEPKNCTYIVLLYCYLGMAMVSAPLVGYYLVRATDIVTFVLLLFGIGGFVLLSLLSFPVLFQIARSRDWVYFLMGYLGVFYAISSIAFSVSALIRQRVSVKGRLAPGIPILAIFLVGIIFGALSPAVLNIGGGAYTYIALIALLILTSLILLGVTLFCFGLMCQTIFSEANRRSA